MWFFDPARREGLTGPSHRAARRIDPGEDQQRRPVTRRRHHAGGDGQAPRHAGGRPRDHEVARRAQARLEGQRRHPAQRAVGNRLQLGLP